MTMAAISLFILKSRALAHPVGGFAALGRIAGKGLLNRLP
ncbi:MAG: hypothetical protein JWO25_1944 [Alphaproteobacteria bacterium]|nr:hypothetical protein [Alphaproteobacteria bacterium]